jgi:hypothetical protein
VGRVHEYEQAPRTDKAGAVRTAIRVAMRGFVMPLRAEPSHREDTWVRSTLACSDPFTDRDPLRGSEPVVLDRMEWR